MWNMLLFGNMLEFGQSLDWEWWYRIQFSENIGRKRKQIQLPEYGKVKQEDLRYTSRRNVGILLEIFQKSRKYWSELPPTPRYFTCIDSLSVISNPRYCCNDFTDGKNKVHKTVTKVIVQYHSARQWQNWNSDQSLFYSNALRLYSITHCLQALMCIILNNILNNLSGYICLLRVEYFENHV